MGEQIRGEDWLPEGWKMEIRVRKTGKKDRYYTDPVNGYIFRSLRDIDRYLLTGKLGRHVTKTKPKESGSSDVKLDVNPLPVKQDVPKKKKRSKPNGMKKSCPAAQGQKVAGNASKREESKAQASKEPAKKKSSTPSKGRTSRPSKKRAFTPFFIRDSDQCEEANAVDIPNLSEIIDTIQKEREGRNTVYVSAPAIGALLGGLSETRPVKRDNNKKPQPQFAFSVCADIRRPNVLAMPSISHVEKDVWNSKNIISSHQDLSSPPEKHSTMDDTKSNVKEESEKPLFGDLLTDPCIDFAIRTLTGAIPFSSEPTEEERYYQQQLNSAMLLRGGNPCQN